MYNTDNATLNVQDIDIGYTYIAKLYCIAKNT